MVLDSTSEAILSEIRTAIEIRKKSYGGAKIGLAFNRSDDGSLNPYYFLLSFFHTSDFKRLKKKYEYGNFLFVLKHDTVENALEFLSNVFEKEEIQLDEVFVSVNAKMNRFVFYPSLSQMGFSYSEWPSYYVPINFDKQHENIMADLKTRLDLPVYPNGQEALLDIFNLHLPNDWYTFSSRFEITIPDFRAKIKNLKISGNRISVDVECCDLTPDDLIVKIFCKSETNSYTSENLVLSELSCTYTIDEEPIMVEAQLFSKSSEDLIDKRSFNFQRPRTYSGIIIEDAEYQILDMIQRGESFNVEFKNSLNPTNSEDFIDSVIAFANSHGGTIYLGVDNKSNLVGFDEDINDKVIDLIADYCNPRIEPEINTKFPVKDKLISIVRVPEGTEKPYFHRKKGILIRAAATDRQIKRIELEEIFNKKRSFSSGIRTI